jgi:DMSO/TMAO reductase YedYZ molybdopterin-dependent catalytic subunit
MESTHQRRISPQPPLGRSALAGVLTAGTAIGIGELVAGVIPGARSLVIAVGDEIIDFVPSGMKEFAVAVFGTNDKTALLVGIGVVLTGFAAIIGFAAARRFVVGATGVVVFGLIGIAAAARQTVGASVGVAVLPGVVATAAGIVVLRFLVLLVAVPPAAPSAHAPTHCSPHRRGFLRAAGIVAVLAAAAGTVGRFLAQRMSAAASRARVVLPPPARRLPPIPDAVAVDVAGMTPFVTPNAEFYRIDTALQVPSLPIEDYRLRVRGMVDNPLELSFADLQGMELIETDITLTCVSNEIGGQLVGNARWLGVRLADVLNLAGIQEGATQVVGRSVDNYTCGFAVEVVFDGRDAIIAIGMNGEPLPLEHGFPARLVVPGLYGYVSATKWLSEIELTTFDAFDQYWVRRGWAQRAPIKTQPRGFKQLQPGRVAVAGVAWAQGRGIKRVEVQVDDGPWVQARLAEELSAMTWRQWLYEWDATPGLHQLRVRATDGTGQIQPEERVPPMPNGATGWHTVSVTVAEDP